MYNKVDTEIEKSVSAGSGKASTWLAFAIFIQPSYTFFLHQAIISYIMFFLQYFTYFGKYVS